MSESKNKIEIVVKMPVGTTGGFFQFEPVRDEQGLVNLTDLWRRFGAIPNREPKQWRRFEGRDFIAALAQQEKVSDAHLFRATRGRNGATYSHWQVALTYLAYLSPEAQMLVNQIVRERLEEEADPELGVRRAVERHTRRLKALGRSDAEIDKRLKTVTKRNTLTSTLQKHGVQGCKDWRKNGFVEVTNALYLGWKGKTAPELRRELDVPAKGNLRDHLGGFDLDQLAFAESVLEQKIEQEKLYGTQQCAQTAHDIGKSVDQFVNRCLSLRR